MRHLSTQNTTRLGNGTISAFPASFAGDDEKASLPSGMGSQDETPESRVRFVQAHPVQIYARFGPDLAAAHLTMEPNIHPGWRVPGFGRRGSGRDRSAELERSDASGCGGPCRGIRLGE